MAASLQTLLVFDRLYCSKIVFDVIVVVFSFAHLRRLWLGLFCACLDIMYTIFLVISWKRLHFSLFFPCLLSFLWHFSTFNINWYFIRYYEIWINSTEKHLVIFFSFFFSCSRTSLGEKLHQKSSLKLVLRRKKM